ncbi:MAG: hypothetical protein ABI882_06085, partial [Acidobacteriota bacterium]
MPDPIAPNSGGNSGRISGGNSRPAAFFSGLLPSSWMGRAMALGIAVWFINWVFSVEGLIFGSGWLKAFVDLASVLALVPFAYFVIKGTRWFFEHLLWRLRRRLLVTYFLLGVLPLLLVIALVAAIGFAIVTGSTLRLAARQLELYLVNSRGVINSLAQEIEPLSPFSMDRPSELRQLLEDRARTLAVVFPELSLGIVSESHPEKNLFVATASDGGEGRGGNEPALFRRDGTTWPPWVMAADSIHGLVAVKTPAGTRQVHVFHQVRIGTADRVRLVLSYPVGEELCRRLTQTTGLSIT